jgi:plastocyanin
MGVTRRTFQAACVGLVGTLAIAACGSSTSGSGSTGPSGERLGGRATTITATGTTPPNNGFGNTSGGEFYFTPVPDTVAAGTQVMFAFADVAHTVTFDGGPVALTNIPATMNADSVRTFATVGTYTWHCSIHPYMHGTVVVQ